MNEQVLRIDIGRIGLQRKIDAVQGDSGRVLKCILTDYAIPPDASARIYAVKPSGAEIYNNCDITGNSSVSVELTTQMLAELGVTRCQVEISKLNKKVTSFEFCIEVKRSLISDTAIESTDEFTALEEALAEARQVTAPVFDEASERVNIQSGEQIGTLFGKIKKWFTDLGAAAFYGVANNLTTTVANMVLDARQGKALDDKISDLNRKFTNYQLTAWVTIPTGTYTGGQYRYTVSDSASAKELMFVIQHANKGSESVFEYVSVRLPYTSFPNSYYRIATSAGTLEFYFAGTTGSIDFTGVPAPVRQVFYRK